jgi:hypothetical protein
LSDSDGLFFRSAEEILAHPRFPGARLAYIDAVMALYESHPAVIELMLDAGRILVFGIIMSLWGAFVEPDPETWPTVTRVKLALAPYRVASARQIDHIIARLVQIGYVTLARAPRDSRLRLVLPTEQMIVHDRDWLRAHYVPLAHIFGDPAYRLALARDPDFQRQQHAAAVETLNLVANRVVRPNIPILQFMTRSAGMLILMKLIRRSEGMSGPVAFPTDIGANFGVSRTHVRDLLAAAAQDGYLTLEAGGRVRLHPPLVSAFDRIVADGMSMHDREHRVAMMRLGQAPESARHPA